MSYSFVDFQCLALLSNVPTSLSPGLLWILPPDLGKSYMSSSFLFYLYFKLDPSSACNPHALNFGGAGVSPNLGIS